MMFKRSIFFVLSLLMLSSTAVLRAKDGHELFFKENNSGKISIIFEPAKLNEQKEIPVAIINTSADPDRIEYLEPPVIRGSSDFSATYSTSYVNPGQEALIRVFFKPDSPGLKKTATIIIRFDDGGDSLVINVSGDAKLPPSADFILFETPNPLDFTAFSTPLRPGDSAFKTFKIKNRGGETGVINAMEFINKYGEFTVIDFKPNTQVPANSFKTFTIRFLAQNPGIEKKNTLRIATSTGTVIALEVKGDVQKLPESKLRLLTDNPLDLHTVRPGDTAKPEQIWIQNMGNKPEEIRKIIFSEESPFFIATPFSFPVTLGPNDSPNDAFRFRVSFSSKVRGSHVDTLRIITASGDTIPLRVIARVEPERLQVLPKGLVFDSMLVNTTQTRSFQIFNPNKIPVEVNFLPLNNAKFVRVEPKGNKAVIPAQGSIEIKISFTPVNTTAENDFFRFSAFGDAYPPLPLSGKGYELPQGKLTVSVAPGELDFKEVFVDSISTLEIKIVNDNNIVLKAREFQIFNSVFSRVNQATVIELPAKTTTTLRIRFQPRDTVKQTGKLEFHVGDNKYTVFLEGKGKAPEQPGSYSTTLAIDNFSVPVGEEFVLPVRFIANKPALAANSRQKFRIELRFTASVLYYPDADNGALPIENGERIITIDSAFDTGNSISEILRLTFQTALGDMPVGHIRISAFTWLNAAGLEIPTDVTLDTATITITGTEGRLVNSNKDQLTLSVSPNPAIGDIKLEFSNYGPGATLKIYNTQGELVRDLSGEINSAATSFKITCPTAGIPEGAYFCRLTSGGNSIVRTIFVQK